jgi:thymidylate synthase (FAD)
LTKIGLRFSLYPKQFMPDISIIAPCVNFIASTVPAIMDEPSIVTIDQLIAYCARVSNPNNQNNPNSSKLIKYCIDHKHWSILEMASVCLEITTSRAIAAQILRHRSFHFQEFSQRYAQSQSFQTIETRLQDTKNRQNSLTTDDTNLDEWFQTEYQKFLTASSTLYNQALDRGIAKEVARFVLPLSTTTRLYMNGTIRDWVHYINLRTGPETQKEHRIIAELAKSIFVAKFPIIAEALGWSVESI